MLANLRIGKRLQGGFLVTSLLCAVVGGTGLLAMAKMKAGEREIAEVHVVQLVEAGRLATGAAQMRRVELAALAAVEIKDRGVFETHRREFTDIQRSIDGAIAHFDSIEMVADEAAYVRALKDGLQDYRGRAENVLQLLAVDSVAAARTLISASKASFDQVNDAAGKLMSSQAAETADVHQNDEIVYARARNIVIAALILAVIAGVIIGAAITRDLVAAVSTIAERAARLRTVCVAQLNEGIRAMARGDLGTTASSSTQKLALARRDELGQLADTIDEMIGATHDTLAEFSRAQGSVRVLVDESRNLTKAARSGSLGVRARADRVDGSFRDVVDGLNATVDAMVTPINEVTSVLASLASRDLTVRMSSRFEGDFSRMTTSLNAAIDTLDRAMTEVAATSEQVAAAAEQIATGSQMLAQGAAQQASSLEEVSSSLQELSSMSRQSASNAKETRALADGARAGTTRGLEDMQRLSGAMDRIKESSDATAKIVKTIDEIAFQTNLLALNAAVEAARAGDAGKGFAVVADEVRNLAMRSAEAAKNTASLIESSVKNAGDGVALSGHVAKSFSEIGERTTRVAGVMSEMSAASDQQTHGVVQINGAIEQMNTITQQVASSSEESASSSEELSTQAGRLHELVSSFTLTSTRHRPTIAPAAPSATSVKSPASKPAIQSPKPTKSNAAAPKPASQQRGPIARPLTPPFNRIAGIDPESIIPFEDDGDDDTLEQF